MSSDMLDRRKPLRLKTYDYSTAGAYFVTVCVFEKMCILGDIVHGQMHENECGRIVREEWLKAPQVRSNVALDAFVVMPNHVHGIIVIKSVGATRRVARTGIFPGCLGAIIGQFKSVAAKRINQWRDTPGGFIWQRGYYDRIVRDERELNDIRQYIEYNPIQWPDDVENPALRQKCDCIPCPEQRPRGHIRLDFLAPFVKMSSLLWLKMI